MASNCQDSDSGGWYGSGLSAHEGLPAVGQGGLDIITGPHSLTNTHMNSKYEGEAYTWTFL